MKSGAAEGGVGGENFLKLLKLLQPKMGYINMLNVSTTKHFLERMRWKQSNKLQALINMVEV